MVFFSFGNASTVPVLGWLASSGAKVDFHFAVDIARVVDCCGGNSGSGSGGASSDGNSGGARTGCFTNAPGTIILVPALVRIQIAAEPFYKLTMVVVGITNIIYCEGGGSGVSGSGSGSGVSGS